MTCLTRRSVGLIAFYAVAAALPVAVSLLPLSVSLLPLLWIGSVPIISAEMILTLWAGIGSHRPATRLLGLLSGLAYLAIWPTVQMWLFIRSQTTTVDFDLSSMYSENLIQYITLGLVLSGVFVITCRWFQLQTAVVDGPASAKSWMQFSVFHLLVLMSVVALVLSLMRSARGKGTLETGIEPNMISAYALVGFTLIANTACAAFAALGPGLVWRNCLLVIVTSVLLGIAFSVASRQESLGVQTFLGGVFAMASPTVLVLASLLWLRPCGLRLVRRQKVGQF